MTKYIKRPSGGYYAQTVVGMVTVERRYEFTSPTRDWVARFGGETVIGTSREDAVERMLTSVHAKEGRSARRDAALDLAEQEDASPAAQRAAVADMYGPTVTEPATDEPPRVLSPMDQDRQIRRLVAELGPQGRQLGLNKDHLWAMATDLYNAGFRATDPGSPIQ